ncbi:MAG: hypothetical protein P8Y27_03500 [Chromatiaceae bacterium]
MALALVRRLSRPANGLLEVLQATEAWLTRPCAIDSLIDPPQPAQALAQLLTPGGSTGAPPRRARAISPEPVLRTLSKPASLNAASRTPDGSREAATASGSRLKQAPALDLRPAADAKAENKQVNEQPARNTAGRRGSDSEHKPASLRDIAEMRRAQKRVPEPSHPLPIPALSNNTSGLPRAAKSKHPGDTPSPESSSGSTHALVTLAKQRARAGLTLPVRNTPQAAASELPASAAQSAGLPAPHKTPQPPASSAALERPAHMAPAAVNRAEAPAPSARQSVDPDLSPMPEVQRDEHPAARPGPRRPEPDNRQRLSDAAWRNGVEPQ